jgi:mannosyltransferase OCH1-like enzyme
MLIKNLLPREDCLIENDCVLIYDEKKYDFICTVYYVDENNARVLIRRMDKAEGWDECMALKIDAVKYSIPRSKENSLGVVLKVSNLRKSVKQKQYIPSTIIQTGESRECSDICLYNTILSFTDKNPEYSYVFFDAKERREFIKENYDEKVLEAYDTLVPNAFKADLFRYCYLYKNGGCYFDYKMILRVPLCKFIKPGERFLVCSDYERSNALNNYTGQSYLNALIFSEPKNELLKNMIDACVVNILKNQAYFLQDIQMRGYQGILDLTGPTLFYKILNGRVDLSCVKYKHLILNNDESNYKNFVIVNLENHDTILTKTYTVEKNTLHYSNLWIRGDVFMKNKRIIDGNVIMVFPHPYPDVFEFDIDHGCVNENGYENTLLTVNRTEGAWWLDLRVRITTKKSDVYDVHIGRNSTNSKFVVLPFGLSSLKEGRKNLKQKNEQELEQELKQATVLYEETVKDTDIKVKDIVIGITSIINIPNNRSCVSTEDRYTQTLKQLENITSCIKNCTVIVLEMSLELPEEYLEGLKKRCDYIIRYTNSEKTNLYCRQHSQKGLGEIHVLTHLGELLKQKEFKWFCKFNGRYVFNDSFDIQKFLNPVPTTKCLPGNGRLKILSETIFYSIPKRYFNLYIAHFESWLDKETVEPVEHIFTMFLESIRNIKLVPVLNIEGVGASHGKLMKL